MQYKIDYIKEEELPATLDLVKKVFDEFVGIDYEQEGIESFYNFINLESIRTRIKSQNMIILVARTTENLIIGMVAISAENHISLLFVDKRFHRKGIGKNLLKFAIDICKYNDEEIEKITVNSSPCSVAFYHNCDFEDLASMQKEDGIEFTPMAYYIEKEENIVKQEDKAQNDTPQIIISKEDEKETDSVYNILSEFYTEHCDEDNRLKKSRVGNLEFITTTTYINKYLNNGDKILEIGAGTGVYSNYYAKEGYEVDAVELLDVNFEKLKLIENDNLRIHKANAIDLTKFPDNTFDITLCLGPMYHLFTEEEQDLAIKEAIRVTKPNGKIFFSYITNDSVIINYLLKEHHLLDKKDLHDENFILKNDPKEIFYVCTTKSFKNKMKNYNTKFLNNIATDGITSILSEDIEYLENEEFEEWIKYHLATCERQDLIGFSSHALYICEKI